MLEGTFSSLNSSATARYRRKVQKTREKECNSLFRSLEAADVSREEYINLMGGNKDYRKNSFNSDNDGETSEAQRGEQARKNSFNDDDDVTEEEVTVDDPESETETFLDSEIPVIFSVEDLALVEEHLSKLAGTLSKRITARTSCLELFLQCYDAFSDETFDWVNQDDFKQCAEMKIQRIFDWMGERKHEFDQAEVVIGFLKFSQFSHEMKSSQSKLKDEEIYKKFYHQNKSNEEMEQFMRFYEFFQVRSYSEALAETVGSLMSAHKSKGRNLDPFYYDQELYLMYNLPSMSVVKETMLPQILKEKLDIQRKKYISKDPSRLNFPHLGSAIGTHRKEQEKLSHLPRNVFYSR